MFLAIALAMIVCACKTSHVFSDGAVVIEPGETIVVFGGNRTVIRCSTDARSATLSWYRKRLGFSLEDKIHGTGSFRIHSIRSGVEELVILRVTVSETGTYTCAVRDGVVQQAAVVLAVVEPVPSCSVNVPHRPHDNSTFDIVENDTVSISCKCRYTKNMPTSYVNASWTDTRGNNLGSTRTSTELNDGLLVETTWNIRQHPVGDNDSIVYTFSAIFGSTLSWQPNNATSRNGRYKLTIFWSAVSSSQHCHGLASR